MRTILYGKETTDSNPASFQQIVNLLYKYSSEVFICEDTYQSIADKIKFPSQANRIRQASEVSGGADFLISVGGDGTFLDSLTTIGSSGLPVLGINTGRLGFLSSVNIEHAERALVMLKDKEYSVTRRKLLQLHPNLFSGENCALNDICIQRIHGTSNMITIDVIVDKEYMNTYWCDGLIIATPTGSTAYSLGCGGPIIVPNAEVFVLTPIASHSLTVRPVIIPSDSEIEIKVHSRNQQFLLSMDSSSKIIGTETCIQISQSRFSVNIVSLNGQNFYKTIREKLMWGMDRRKIE